MIETSSRLKCLAPMMMALIPLAVTAGAFAELRLPHLFGDGMVLQRDMPIRIWGWADPGRKISVTLDAESAGTVADENGRWSLELPARPAGGPVTLRVVAEGGLTLEFKDILIGEVWLCSGQSNMEWPMHRSEGGQEELAKANWPNIRFFMVPRSRSGYAQDHLAGGVWQPAVTEGTQLVNFSAVAYHFGTRLRRELDVPVGLITSVWGGSRIESWMPADAFEGYESLKPFRDNIERSNKHYQMQVEELLPKMKRWTQQAEAAIEAGTRVPEPPALPRHPLDGFYSPTGMYNSMIAPLPPFAIRGVLWYQGESNVTAQHREIYLALMKALIASWREKWARPNMPFYYVQLAPFVYDHWRLPEDELPTIWDVQRRAMAVPNTGMVVTTDVGNLQDIHPADKKTVGHRLADWALARTYGREDIAYSGPMVKKAEIADGSVRVHFDHAEGLKTRDGKVPDWFELADAEGNWHEATAKIDNQTVVVTSEKVQKPSAVRFGWSQRATPNLVNAADLPASPFQIEIDQPEPATNQPNS